MLLSLICLSILVASSSASSHKKKDHLALPHHDHPLPLPNQHQLHSLLASHHHRELLPPLVPLIKLGNGPQMGSKAYHDYGDNNIDGADILHIPDDQNEEMDHLGRDVTNDEKNDAIKSGQNEAFANFQNEAIKYGQNDIFTNFPNDAIKNEQNDIFTDFQNVVMKRGQNP